MAFAPAYLNNVPTWVQSGTDTSLVSLSTAFTALPTVARSKAYAVNTFLKPATPNGMWYRVSVAGTTSANSVGYNTTEGGTTTDGTAILIAIKEPSILVLNNGTSYFMTSWAVQINGTLTIANPMYETWEVRNWIVGSTGVYTSGTYAADGVTPLTSGVHVKSWQAATNADALNTVNTGGVMKLIGGSLWGSAVQTNVGSFLTLDGCDLVAVRAWSGISTFRVRNYSVGTVFKNVRTYGFGFDLFRMPTVAPTIRGFKSEYVYQYVGASAGGADAYFKASSLANIDGSYDFDNYFGGWVELFNCAAGAALKVVCQYPGGRASHCVPLYQNLKFNVTNLAGAIESNVAIKTTDAPTNSPATTITTVSGLKTWDFRNPLSYSGVTDGSGALSLAPILQVWYGTSNQKNLRFPSSTATFKLSGYNVIQQTVNVVLGSDTVQNIGVAMVNATNLTLTQVEAAALTGITFAQIGLTGGTFTTTTPKTIDEIWAAYRNFVNNDMTETWTYNGSELNIGNWNWVNSTSITGSGSISTNGTITNTGTIQVVYSTTAGTSTVLEINPPSDGYSLCLYQGTTTKYFASNVTAGSYYVYLSPSEAGTYTLAAENYGQKRTQDTLVLNGGSVWYNITDSEDVGITATKSVAAAYTTLSTTEQIYDATAVFRLTETGIKIGQLVARDGLYLDFGTYNVKLKDDASAIVGVATGTITYKSIVINEATKYNAMKATPPATITPTDTEQINVLIEDANGDSQLSILGGDNLGYELWKVTTTTATDDYATGTLLATLTTNAEVFRFIGISGYDIVGRDVSSGVRRRTSMVKGTYEQAFYVGNQIQLATDAPQLIENNEKLDELILKIDTNLDEKISTRLAEIDYVAPHNTEIDAIKLKVDTLENTDLTGIATATNVTDAKDEIIAELANIDVDLTGIATSQNVTDAKDEIIAELANIDVDLTGVALEATSQSIITKVDAIQSTVDNINVDFTPVLDAIDTKPTLAQIEASTILANKTDITDAQASIENKIDNIVVDNAAISAQVWQDQPERLKQVATVETTGEQISSFNI